MKIQYIDGEITNPVQQGSSGSIIGHIVNNRGAWGGGVSGLVSRKWQETYEDYVAAHQESLLKMGGIISTEVQSGEHPIIVSSMVAQNGVKKFYVDDVYPLDPIKYDSLILCLKKMAPEMVEKNFSFHCMKLGTYYAGANWKIVREILEEQLISTGIQVVVYNDPRINEFSKKERAASKRTFILERRQNDEEE